VAEHEKFRLNMLGEIPIGAKFQVESVVESNRRIGVINPNMAITILNFWVERPSGTDLLYSVEKEPTFAGKFFNSFVCSFFMISSEVAIPFVVNQIPKTEVE
jgi:hypothetical protein